VNGAKMPSINPFYEKSAEAENSSAVTIAPFVRMKFPNFTKQSKIKITFILSI